MALVIAGFCLSFFPRFSFSSGRILHRLWERKMLKFNKGR